MCRGIPTDSQIFIIVTVRQYNYANKSKNMLHSDILPTRHRETNHGAECQYQLNNSDSGLLEPLPSVILGKDFTQIPGVEGNTSTGGIST